MLQWETFIIPCHKPVRSLSDVHGDCELDFNFEVYDKAFDCFYGGKNSKMKQ